MSGTRDGSWGFAGRIGGSIGAGAVDRKGPIGGPGARGWVGARICCGSQSAGPRRREHLVPTQRVPGSDTENKREWHKRASGPDIGSEKAPGPNTEAAGLRRRERRRDESAGARQRAPIQSSGPTQRAPGPDTASPGTRQRELRGPTQRKFNNNI